MLELKAAFSRRGFRLEIGQSLAAPVTAVFGPSGAGKSTLLHLIAGLLRPAEGRIVLDGEVLVDTASGLFVPPHRRRVGLVFQDARLFPNLDVRGNLAFARRYAPREGHRLALDEVADLLALRPLLSRPVRALSGGEAQRVALGRALLSAPRLLLLDEPMASLDRELKGQVLPFLKRVQAAANIPVLYVTHDLAEALQLTRQVLVLDRGRAVAHGPLLDLLGVPDALALFRGQGLTNVLQAVVAEHRADQGTTLYAPRASGEGREEDGLRIRGPHAADLSVGQPADLLLAPSEVALSLAPVTGTSIQNQVPGRVREVLPAEGRAIVVVEGAVTLLSEITPASVRRLGLAPGLPVWCLFKTQGVRVLPGR